MAHTSGGPKPSAISLDMAFNEGWIAGSSFAWKIVGSSLTQARDRITERTQQVRSENQQFSGQNGEAA